MEFKIFLVQKDIFLFRMLKMFFFLCILIVSLIKKYLVKSKPNIVNKKHEITAIAIIEAVVKTNFLTTKKVDNISQLTPE